MLGRRHCSASTRLWQNRVFSVDRSAGHRQNDEAAEMLLLRGASRYRSIGHRATLRLRQELHTVYLISSTKDYQIKWLHRMGRT